LGLFVERLPENLNKMNAIFKDISALFVRAGISDMSSIPADLADRGKFAKLFREFNAHLEAAKIQGFTWNQSHYEFGSNKDNQETIIDLGFDENAYLVLALRYKELFPGGGGGGDGTTDIPYEIDGHLTEIDTGKIDSDYMNSQFTKYLKLLTQPNVDAGQLQQTLDEVHRSFAYLSQEEQKYAGLFLRDIQRGDVEIPVGMTLREHVTNYLAHAKSGQIGALVRVFGLDESKLRSLMGAGLTEATINEYGRFDELKNTVDKDKAKTFFEEREGTTIPPFKINVKTADLLQRFILGGGFDL
jgi:type I restriction enzyme R subunit